MLALLLAPVVIIAGPAAPGNAAIVNGATDTVTFTALETNWPYHDGDIKCTVKARELVNTTSSQSGVEGSLTCRWEIPLTDDPSDDTTNGTTALTFNGTDPGAGGGACQVMANQGDDALSTMTFTTMGPGPNGPTCHYDEVCWEIDWTARYSHNPDYSAAATGCHSINLDPGVAPATCPYGTPTTASWWHVAKPGSSPTQWYGDSTLSVAERNTTVPWQLIGVNSTDAQSYGVTTSPSNPVSPGAWTGATWNTTEDQWNSNTVQDPAKTPKGVWVTAGTDWNQAGGGRQALGLAALGSSPLNLRVGMTVPAQCVFWFGPKILDIAGDADEPYAALGAQVSTGEPAPTTTEADLPAAESDCNFSITDPTTWAGEAMCAIGGLLMRALGLLGDLLGFLGHLLADLLGLLKDLFIPDIGSWGFGDLMDQFRNKPPFSLISPLASTAQNVASGYSAAGSCGTVANFPITGVTDRPITCTGVQNSPGLSGLYNIVRIALITLTGLACFRMLAGLVQDGQ